jgi:uncharacterized protein (TIGR00255 family)
MTVRSMTGFARAAGQDARFAWTWEARSVNARGLDIRCRVPGGHEAAEQTMRASAAKRFQRGNVTIGLSVDRLAGAAQAYRVNRALLEQVTALRTELDGMIDDARPTLEGLLSIRGMLEPDVEAESEEEIAGREAAILTDGEAVLEALAAARADEGARLAPLLDSHLADLETLIGEAAGTAAVQPEALRARLEALVAELLGTEPRLPEERLAQETALLVGKADVREELDRLGVHVGAARELLGSGEAAGRRLDFLCQELNREANTLCSKSADVELTRVGLAMKAVIEQFREQIQNVE